ncbi:glycosyltransferase family 39 protein [Candidatus Woesearchaeota archaeon]|nr:glycosyltransferase family 39 protein [Candidatus Woesearchaeota archaeon]
MATSNFSITLMLYKANKRCITLINKYAKLRITMKINGAWKHRFLIVILLIAAFLLFTSLTDRYLWGDEAEVSLLSKNILAFGYPSMNDGRNIIFSDYKGDIILPVVTSGDYVWKWHPWLPHYVIAASFSLFGMSTFAARFPFALASLLTIILTYFLALKISNKKTANLAALLLALYVPFYLYSRQSRYYALAILLTVAVLYAYVKFLRSERYAPVWLAAALVLTFYTNYNAFFSLYLALGAHFLLFNYNWDKLKKLILISLAVACLTLPWFLYASLGSKYQGFQYNILFGLAYLVAYFSLYIFPVVFWALLYALFRKRLLGKEEASYYYLLLLFVSAALLVNVLIIPWELPTFRYIIILFPVAAVLSARIIEAAWEHRRYMAIALLVLLVSSNALFIFLLKPVEPIALDYTEKDSESYFFVKENLQLRFLLWDYLYEITHHYEGPTEKLVNYLLEHGNRDDTFLTNTNDLSIIFYTDMISYKVNEQLPDWVIPREASCSWGNLGKEACDYLANLLAENKDKYEEILIESTDYIYILDEPHPRTHRFRENAGMPVYRHETYPLKIYRLNNG